MDTGHESEEGVGGEFLLDQDKAMLWSLVLSAAEVPHRLAQEEDGWRLLVPESLRGVAWSEIMAFEQENSNWPPVSAELAEDRASEPPTVLVIGGLAIFYLFTGGWATESIWFKVGALSARRIFAQGEWWRLVTALTLHADVVHLAGNMVVGGMVIHFLCQRLGSGFGWWLVFLAGTLGNLVNALLRGEEQLAVGFSTAIFGAVGVLSGLRWRAQERAWQGWLLPIGGGVGLLALLGSEGEHVDLGAHFWGLLVGGLLGLGLGRMASFGTIIKGTGWQLFFGIAAGAMVVGCWLAALGRL